MAEMRLNLQLSGVREMTTAIGRLNSALLTLNSILNRTAQSLNAIANGLRNTAGTIPPSMRPPRPRTPGGGGGGGNPNNANQSPQDAFSILFSVFSGAWKNVGAKLGTGLLRNLNLSIGALTKFAFVAGLAYFGVMLLVKAFQSATAHLNEVARLHFTSGLAGGTLTKNQQIQNIAMMFGMKPEDVAADASTRANGVTQLIQELRKMRGLTGDAKRIYANQRGLEGYAAIDSIDFEGNLNNNRNLSTQAMVAESTARTNLEWAKTVSEFKQVVTVFWLAIKTLITNVIKFNPLTYLAKGFNYFTDRIDAITSGKDIVAEQMSAAKKQKEAAQDLKDAAYILKEGTYGGGERARGAIPSAWTWNASMMINNARNLGAFEY